MSIWGVASEQNLAQARQSKAKQTIGIHILIHMHISLQRSVS
jgi:hypothetical protein